MDAGDALLFGQETQPAVVEDLKDVGATDDQSNEDAAPRAFRGREAPSLGCCRIHGDKRQRDDWNASSDDIIANRKHAGSPPADANALPAAAMAQTLSHAIADVSPIGPISPIGPSISRLKLDAFCAACASLSGE